MPILIVVTLALLGCGEPKVKDTSDLPQVGEHPAFYGERPKNLLVISMDTFRRDMMARYGGDPWNTPWLDSIAEGGMVLDQHTTCSNWTKGGMACAVNGQYSYQWGMIPRLAEQESGPSRTTLASMLAAQGYDTYLVTSNGWLLDAGLDGGYAETSQPDSNRATSIAETGIGMLESRMAGDDTPWFMHLHFIEPHAAYNPPSEYLVGIEDLPPLSVNLADREQHYALLPDWPIMTEEEQETLVAHLWLRYRGDVRWLDDTMSLIWTDLEVRGLLDDTLVVFWTDHGEQFFEHEKQTHVWGLYREENDGLAIFWSKNIVPMAWNEPTNHIDLAPTIVSALGMVPGNDWTGLPVGLADPERPIIAESWSRAGPRMAVSVGQTKLIYDWNSGAKELYDMEADPGELSNLYDSSDERAIAMWTPLMEVVNRWEVLVGGSAGAPTNPGP